MSDNVSQVAALMLPLFLCISCAEHDEMPSLPHLDAPSFSYEEIMAKRIKLEQRRKFMIKTREDIYLQGEKRNEQ